MHMHVAFWSDADFRSFVSRNRVRYLAPVYRDPRVSRGSPWSISRLRGALARWSLERRLSPGVNDTRDSARHVDRVDKLCTRVRLMVVKTVKTKVY